MKKLIDNLLRTVLVVLVLSLSSCQEEYQEIDQGGEGQAIAANSTTAILIKNTSSYDGSFDNIVDGASCFAIQFPYTVNVNGVDVTIDSKNDLEIVEEIFDELDDDNDVLDIAFPITVTLSDFTEISIKNHGELETMARECIEGGDDDDIECIDFVYPVTLFTFGVDNQQSGQVEIKSDLGMRRFFDELDDDNELISIQFPVTLKKHDGTQITVGSNTELAAALETSKNECDEDDDDDYNDDDFTLEELDDLLLACPLEVRQVIRDEVDNTEQYFEQLMTFSQDGTVVLASATTSITGTWTTAMAENGVLLSVDFQAVADFTLDWYVYELEDGFIKLHKDNGNKIILKERCDAEPSEVDRETLISMLQECEWIVKKIINQGNEVKRLLGYEFQFKAGGTVTLGNGVNVSQGSWDIGLNSQLELSLMITMEGEPEVSYEWPISELTDSRFKFNIDESDNEMVLLQVCDDSADDGDVAEIRSMIMDGSWNIALYQEGAVQLTTAYTGMEFNFSTMHQMEVLINADPVANGLWRVLRDSEEGLKLYINFDTGDDLVGLTNDWKVVSITSTRIELTDESDDDSLDTLVFEKP